MIKKLGNSFGYPESVKLLEAMLKNHPPKNWTYFNRGYEGYSISPISLGSGYYERCDSDLNVFRLILSCFRYEETTSYHIKAVHFAPLYISPKRKFPNIFKKSEGEWRKYGEITNIFEVAYYIKGARHLTPPDIYDNRGGHIFDLLFQHIIEQESTEGKFRRTMKFIKGGYKTNMENHDD